MPKLEDLKIFCVILIISYLQLILNLEPEQHFDARGHAIVGKNYSFMEIESCGYLSPKDKPQMRIINGDFARIGEFPWQVNIMNNWRRDGFNHICSGVLIHKYWVMTAAHCLQDEKSGPKPLEMLNISFGSIYFQKIFLSVGAVHYITHPLFDLGLIRLSQPVLPVLNKKGTHYRINYVCLPQQWIINERNERTIISGFGWSYPEDKPYNEELRKAYIKIDSFIDCQTLYYNQFWICGKAFEQRTCHGDSGSGLIQFDGNRAVVIGIVKGGHPYDPNDECGPGIVDFMRISYFITYLRNAINDYKDEETDDTAPLSRTGMPLSNCKITMILMITLNYSFFKSIDKHLM